MRTKRVEQAVLTIFLVAACAALFIAALGAIAHAQNPSTALTIPQQSEVPVSNPGAC